MISYIKYGQDRENMFPESEIFRVGRRKEEGVGMGYCGYSCLCVNTDVVMITYITHVVRVAFVLTSYSFYISLIVRTFSFL